MLIRAYCCGIYISDKSMFAKMIKKMFITGNNIVN
jgi:hypothetical protein